MQYVFDSNILIDIYQNYYPEVFESVWEKIEELISNEIMVSITEVREELKSKNIRDQWLKINNNCNGLLFRELIAGEEECIPLIEDLPMIDSWYNICEYHSPVKIPHYMLHFQLLMKY